MLLGAFGSEMMIKNQIFKFREILRSWHARLDRVRGQKSKFVFVEGGIATAYGQVFCIRR
jgi:hypothetical protein